MNIAAIGLFFLALGLQSNASTEEYSHEVYAIDCCIWILRLLSVFYADRILGPYVVMIRTMVCIYFLVFLLLSVDGMIYFSVLWYGIFWIISPETVIKILPLPATNKNINFFCTNYYLEGILPCWRSSSKLLQILTKIREVKLFWNSMVFSTHSNICNGLFYGNNYQLKFVTFLSKTSHWKFL